ncbi:MAG: hypothetical protein Fues2KO_34210 [Fuerstiella sp.]
MAPIVVAVEPAELPQPDPMLQPWRFSYFPELEGKGLRCVEEDVDGRIWFGLKDGIIAYDGYHWERLSDVRGQHAVEIRDLYRSPNGPMLAASEHGLLKISADGWHRLFPRSPEASLAFTVVWQSADRTIWGGTEWGLVRIRNEVVCLFTSAALKPIVEDLSDFDQVEVWPDDQLPKHLQSTGSSLSLVGRRIVQLDEAGPARAAGLRAGDLVVSVNGVREPVQRVVREFQQPAGAKLTVVVRRQDREQPFEFEASANRSSAPDPAVNCIFEDREERLWVGLTRGQVLMSPPEEAGWIAWSKAEGFQVNAFPYIVQTDDDRIHVLSAGRVNNVATFHQQSWTTADLSIGGGRGFNGSAVALPGGRILSSGIKRIQLFQDNHWVGHDTRDLKLPGAGHRLLVARDGAVWIIGQDRAPVRIAMSDDEYFSVDGVHHVCSEPTGVDWFVDRRSRTMLRKDAQTVLRFNQADGLIDTPDAAVALPGGGIIAFGAHQGSAAVAHFDGVTWQLETFPQLARRMSGRAALVTKDGQVWLSAKRDRIRDQHGGIIHWDGNRWQHLKPPIAPHSASAIVQPDADTIWCVGEYGIAAVRTDGEHWIRVRTRGPRDAMIESAAVDQNGVVWLATQSQGLLQGVGDRWTPWTTQNGLPTNEIGKVHATTDGRLLVSTHDGLFLFDGSSFHSAADQADWGRQSIESSASGAVWLNGTHRISRNHQAPKVISTTTQSPLGSDGRGLVTWQGIDRWNRTPAAQLTYSWQIDDGPWSAFSGRTQVQLSELAAGPHQISVAARDSDGNISKSPAVIRISVAAPFWRQWWFVTFVTTAIAAVGFLSTRLLSRGLQLRQANQELAAAQENLAEQFATKSAQFRAICDCSPVGIFVTDRDATVTYTNDYLNRVAGLPQGSSNVSDWMKTIHPEHQDRIRRDWKQAFRQRQSFAASGRFVGDQRSERWFDVVADPIYHEDIFLGFVGALDDVTAQRQASDKLQRTNDRLQQTMDRLQQAQDKAIRQERLNALGQMAAGVAHDINNTLTPLLNYAEMLQQQGTLNDQGRHWASLIRLGVADTAETVRRLNHFYRESHNRSFLEVIDLGHVVEQSIELTRPQWQDTAQHSGRQIKLTFDVDRNLMVRGDASQLRSALTNLIFNAVDAISESGHIRLLAKAENELAVVEVDDSGDGMTLEQLQKCREPFYTSKPHGSGLGLSECHGIIRQHGGQLHIRSSPGCGTTVRVQIPREPEPVMGVTTADQSDQNGTSTSTDNDSPARNADRSLPLRQPTVLYIDDNDLVRQSTSALLQAAGAVPITAHDGPSGLQVLEDHRVQMVVCDQGLPGMDGLSVMREIRRRWPGLPVVMVSGWTLPDTSPEHTPEAFLEKPFSLAGLKTVIQQHAQRPVGSSPS